eukprot:CAMPEP_0202958274 /NCGR_PEP_ID=MMETSP1396-20130829/2631_1 /ASSEMBLY_ACC=CAM_ASM_000872 /TAXON_ID= /ORGANISM="Pseudokeronopsis sp., Strain Brazil" /LENGTH=62 /DNA_ID=CAMNT_0049676255 /DNA_START=703 /DNA_END=891 /DNA_ORIENTATION=-
MIDFNNPSSVYIVKNSGEMFIGKQSDKVVVSSELALFEEMKDQFTSIEPIPNNTIIELKEDF